MDTLFLHVTGPGVHLREPVQAGDTFQDDDVWGKPRALQGWHQRLGMYLRLEQVHADEHQGQ